MMSSFFKTATIASISGIVAYLATYLPFMVSEIMRTAGSAGSVMN